MTQGEPVPGDIIQLSPIHHAGMFAGMLVIVTHADDFGVNGYIEILGDEVTDNRLLEYSAKRGTFEICGKVRWARG
jgi:hypothetical protein